MFPLSSGPGTLDNGDSETDASCLRSKQATNNFPSQKICTRTGLNLQTLFTSRQPLLTVAATTQRGGDTVTFCPQESGQDCVCGPCIQNADGFPRYRRACVCVCVSEDAGVCGAQTSLSTGALLRCVCALFGFGKETHGVIRQTASPGIFTAQLMAFDLFGSTSMNSAPTRTGALCTFCPAFYNMPVNRKCNVSVTKHRFMAQMKRWKVTKPGPVSKK